MKTLPLDLCPDAHGRTQKDQVLHSYDAMAPHMYTLTTASKVDWHHF